MSGGRLRSRCARTNVTAMSVVGWGVWRCRSSDPCEQRARDEMKCTVKTVASEMPDDRDKMVGGITASERSLGRRRGV